MKKSAKEKSMKLLILAGVYAATAGVFYLAATRTHQPAAGLDGVRVVSLVLLIPLLAKYVLQLLCSTLYSLADRLGKSLEAIGMPAAGVCAKQTALSSQMSRIAARLPESPPRNGPPRHTAPKKENSLAP
jgi:hypothetical protein